MFMQVFTNKSIQNICDTFLPQQDYARYMENNPVKDLTYFIEINQIECLS